MFYIVLVFFFGGFVASIGLFLSLMRTLSRFNYWLSKSTSYHPYEEKVVKEYFFRIFRFSLWKRLNREEVIIDCPLFLPFYEEYCKLIKNQKIVLLAFTLCLTLFIFAVIMMGNTV